MTSSTAQPQTRQVPPLGGLNLTALRLEIRRVLRNRRTLVFILIFPTVFFVLFGLPAKHEVLAGHSALAYIMISMAVYGAMVGTTSGGAAVAVERSLGWSRQLRLTPLRPVAYVLMKLVTAMVLGLIAVVVVFVVGALTGVRMPLHVWLLSALAAWLCSLVFAAFGLFVGFLLPSENVMQYVGPLLAILAVFGGVFVPLDVFSHTLQDIAKFTPVYGVGVIARSPLVGGFTATAVANVVIWTALFGFGAMRLFRRDTARV
ncbi:ABC transporter permease [Rugosimonospora africana]|uniref:Transport permease protein n=1 Tax=Rugosimonospora africana TaxID=556532 RepID=A0A8J3QPJ5_9ACTN|nr:ABC transporter permease [Rugosimonospora africana]GIH13402.1 ABC transporter [Rugosimonospora africana]